MKYAKWILVTIATICLGLFFTLKDYEITRDPAWPEDMKAFVNPIMNRMRVVDATDNTTLFYYPASDSVKPVKFSREGDAVVVTFAKN